MGKSIKKGMLNHLPRTVWKKGQHSSPENEWKKGEYQGFGFRKGCKKLKNAYSFPKGKEHPMFMKGYKVSGKKNGSYVHGLTRLQRLEKLAGRKKPEQCEICGIYEKELKQRLCFDHDHENGKFRGWICHRCNRVLGVIKDDSELLNKLSKYLKKYEQ